MYNSMKLYRESRRYREMKFNNRNNCFFFSFFFYRNSKCRGGGGSKLKKPGFRENERKEWTDVRTRLRGVRINRRFNALRYYSPSLVILFFESDWTDCNWH